MRDIIIDLQESARWENQLTVAVNFVSSRDTEEEPVMHSKGGRINLHLLKMQMKLLLNSSSQFLQDIIAI